MMTDMNESDLVPGERRELTMSYHDGRTRRVLVVDHEVAYPDGKLIVSRTDTQGVITHVNQAFVDMSGYDRESMIVEFTDLAKKGLQTPQPLWMHKDDDQLPDWAKTRKQEWVDFVHSKDKLSNDNKRRRQEMVKALDPKA